MHGRYFILEVMADLAEDRACRSTNLKTNTNSPLACTALSIHIARYHFTQVSSQDIELASWWR